MMFSSSEGQFLTRSLARFFRTDGSLIFGPAIAKLEHHAL